MLRSIPTQTIQQSLSKDTRSRCAREQAAGRKDASRLIARRAWEENSVLGKTAQIVMAVVDMKANGLRNRLPSCFHVSVYFDDVASGETFVSSRFIFDYTSICLVQILQTHQRLSLIPHRAKTILVL